MTTPAQSIFPKKPKDVISPLTPKAIADAIKAKYQQTGVQPEREEGDGGGEAPKASRGNRLLRKAQSED